MQERTVEDKRTAEYKRESLSIKKYLAKSAHGIVTKREKRLGVKQKTPRFDWRHPLRKKEETRTTKYSEKGEEKSEEDTSSKKEGKGLRRSISTNARKKIVSSRYRKTNTINQIEEDEGEKENSQAYILLRCLRHSLCYAIFLLLT